MADFDAIYEEDDDDTNGYYSDDQIISIVPDPIIVRGSGNITM